MENKPIDAETPVLEESVEDTVIDSPVVDDNIDAPVSGGADESYSVGTPEEVFSGADVVEDVVIDAPENVVISDEHVDEESSEEVTDSLGEAAQASPAPLSGPLPVYLVDNPEESSIELYAASGSVYPGTISTTYLAYFEGIADKLPLTDHYVVFRSGQYSYEMYWGDSLTESSGQFSGDNLNYCSVYTGTGSQNMTVSWGTDSLALSAGTGYVYSDLGRFPNLAKGGTSVETLTILFALAFFAVYNVCHDIYDYVMEYIYRK